MGGGTDVA
jgi:Zn2+/Cd2+-exporting ATPase